MTSNYPPPTPGAAPGMGAPTEQFSRPPGMGTVTSSQPPSADPLSVMRRGPVRGRDQTRGWMTSEFAVFALVALGSLLASALVQGNGDRVDYFRADKAWFYITLLAIAYIVSRGLAKIGGRNADD
ncbi:MAG TPA: hypothetical protein VGD73_14060 [Pseudonocardia sp.]|jgi:hypothetical protein|uniref:hypothetical protein n=1 Tax=Pseudonocardia sp. TaxID=60912 RepID=UPI002EDB278A